VRIGCTATVRTNTYPFKSLFLIVFHFLARYVLTNIKLRQKRPSNTNTVNSVLTFSTTTRVLVLATAFFALGGCLSQEKSTSGGGFSKTTTGSQNSPPTIWGSPDSAVMTGDNYLFTPNANDADGDTITFAIVNKPRWANFDTATGRLSGQPLLGDEGTYSNISINANDGTATANLPAFSIEVTQTALGAMTLSWTPPTENTDGSTLTDLAGYKLYYGTSAGSYTHQVWIDNPSINTYMIENLLPDTYYVVATSFNDQGIESTYSNMAIKTVGPT